MNDTLQEFINVAPSNVMKMRNGLFDAIASKTRAFLLDDMLEQTGQTTFIDKPSLNRLAVQLLGAKKARAQIVDAIFDSLDVNRVGRLDFEGLIRRARKEQFFKEKQELTERAKCIDFNNPQLARFETAHRKKTAKVVREHSRVAVDVFEEEARQHLQNIIGHRTRELAKERMRTAATDGLYERLRLPRASVSHQHLQVPHAGYEALNRPGLRLPGAMTPPGERLRPSMSTGRLPLPRLATAGVAGGFHPTIHVQVEPVQPMTMTMRLAPQQAKPWPAIDLVSEQYLATSRHVYDSTGPTDIALAGRNLFVR